MNITSIQTSAVQSVKPFAREWLKITLDELRLDVIEDAPFISKIAIGLLLLVPALVGSYIVSLIAIEGTYGELSWLLFWPLPVTLYFMSFYFFRGAYVVTGMVGISFALLAGSSMGMTGAFKDASFAIDFFLPSFLQEFLLPALGIHLLLRYVTEAVSILVQKVSGLVTRVLQSEREKGRGLQLTNWIGTISLMFLTIGLILFESGNYWGAILCYLSIFPVGLFKPIGKEEKKRNILHLLIIMIGLALLVLRAFFLMSPAG